MTKTNNRKFYSLNDFFKDKFNEKVFKVSLDANFTCPNRDGKISTDGCIFCSETGSGEFTANKVKNITEQIDDQLIFLKDKIKNRNVIAYFQNFSNTYGSIEYLRKIYYEALQHPKVIGIAIATRPDCIDENVLNLIEEINKNYFLWIELGLQTSNDNIAMLINRGYKTEKYFSTAKLLNEKNIKFVTHMIVGLPNETKEDIFKTATDIIKSKAWGIKIHSLYILKGTTLEKIYNETHFKIFSLDKYVDIVVSILKILPENIVVHRITGDGKKDQLIEPIWSLNKRKVLNEIEKKLVD